MRTKNQTAFLLPSSITKNVVTTTARLSQRVLPSRSKPIMLDPSRMMVEHFEKNLDDQIMLRRLWLLMANSVTFAIDNTNYFLDWINKCPAKARQLVTTLMRSDSGYTASNNDVRNFVKQFLIMPNARKLNKMVLNHPLVKEAVEEAVVEYEDPKTKHLAYAKMIQRGAAIMQEKYPGSIQVLHKPMETDDDLRTIYHHKSCPDILLGRDTSKQKIKSHAAAPWQFESLVRLADQKIAEERQKDQTWAFTAEEMRSIVSYYYDPSVILEHDLAQGPLGIFGKSGEEDEDEDEDEGGGKGPANKKSKLYQCRCGGTQQVCPKCAAKTRKPTVDKMFSPIAVKDLLRHNFKGEYGPDSNNVILVGGKKLLKVAGALALVRIVDFWNDQIKMPFDRALLCSDSARTKAGLLPVARDPTTTIEDCLIEIHPYLPKKERVEANRLLRKFKGRKDEPLVMLTESNLHFRNSLSSDYHDTLLLMQNFVPYCRMSSKDGSNVVRAAMRMEEDDALPTLTALGKNRGLMALKAKEAEVGEMNLWTEWNNLVAEVTNEEMRKLLNLSTDEDTGKWKQRYLAHKAGEDTTPFELPCCNKDSENPEIPRGFSSNDKYEESIPLVSEELAFYKSMQEHWCRLHPGEELSYEPLPYNDVNLTVYNGSYHSSYDLHQDSGAEMISDDPQRPKVLSNGIQLPYRVQMSVGTTIKCLKGAAAETDLYHGPKIGGKLVAVTKLTTGNNSSHWQQSGMNADMKHHKAVRVPNQKEPSTKTADGKALMLTDIVDAGIPEYLMKMIKDVPVTAAMLKFRNTASFRQVPCPKKDKEIYLAGMKSEKMLPSNISARPGFELCNRYDVINCQTVKREVDKERDPEAVADAAAAAWYMEDKGYWAKTASSSAANDGECDREKLHDHAYDLENLPVPNLNFEKWGIPDDGEWKKMQKKSVQVNDRIVTGLSRPHRRVVPYGKTGKLAMHFATTNMLARKKIRLELLQPDKTTIGPNPMYVDPRTGAPFAPGDLVDQELVGMKITRHRIPTIDLIFRDKNMGVHIYKNKPYPIDQMLVLGEEIRGYCLSSKYKPGTKEHERLRKEYEEKYHFDFCGTGGSGRPRGATALNAGTASHLDTHYVMGPGQDPRTPENLALGDCVFDENAMAFFVWLPKWLEPKRDQTIDLSGIRKRAGMPEVVAKGKKRNKGKEPAEEEPATMDEDADGDVEVNDLDEAEKENGFDVEVEEGAVDVSKDPLAELEEPTRTGKDRGKALFVGYFYPRSSEYRALEMAELQAMYEHYPKYIEQNSWNLSHWRIKTMTYHFSYAVDFDVFCQMIIDGNKQDKEPFKVLQVAGNDQRLPTSDIRATQQHIFENKLLSDEEQQICNEWKMKEAPELFRKADDNTQEKGRALHPGMIRTHEFLHSYGTCPDKLISELGAKEAEKYMLLELQKTVLYDLDPPVLIPVGVASMGVGSQRFDKEVSTINDATTNCIRSGPLVGVDSDGTDLSMYPDPLRTRPMPCSNPDGDTATAFLAGQGHLYVQEIMCGNASRYRET